MTSCGRGRDSATRGCFGRRLSRDVFRSKLENISFLSRVMSVSKSFLFPALLKDLAPNVQALRLLVSTTVFGGLFENSAPSPGIFLQNSDYVPRVLFQSRVGVT